MKNVVALVNLHNSPNLGILTASRPLASTTFLGRYTFIDFALSNLTNSGIDNIGILVKNQSRSIIKHLGSESTYLKNPKTGFQSLFINEYGINNPLFNTDVNNILANDWFLYDKNAKYIVIVPCQFVCKIDFSKILQEHIESNKVVSVVYHETSHADTRFINCDTLVVDALGNVQKFDVNMGENEKAYISLETYIFNADYLREILSKIPDISSLFSLKDIVHFIVNYKEKVHAIRHSGYCRYYGSLKDYMDYSFELLDKDNLSSNLFTEDWKYYTTTHNSTPVLYGQNAIVKNSLLANGCRINGEVNHSILARNVIIEEGASVSDSIIFTDTIVKKGCHVKHAIIDKHCLIKNKEEVSGEKDNPIYIPQGANI